MTSPSIDEIEQYLKSATNGHKLVHTRFSPIDVSKDLVIAALEQVKQAVLNIQCGVSSPEDHRAEALLLMLFQEAIHHGYTPKGK